MFKTTVTMGILRLFGGILAVMCVAGKPCEDAPRPNTNYLGLAGKFGPFDDNTTLNVSCLPGFSNPDPKTPMAFVCHNGTWIAPPACIKKKCNAPPEVTNGQYTLSGSATTEYGNCVHYKCNDGFYLLGSSETCCELATDGRTVSWGSVPVCAQIQCRAPPTIQNASATNVKDTYNYGEVVTYTCNGGSAKNNFLALVGSNRIVCSEDNTWKPGQPRCVWVKCPIPSPPENGRLQKSPAGPGHYGEEITATCNQGFTMRGSGVSRCDENGTWTPPLPVCVHRPTSAPVTGKTSTRTERLPSTAARSPTVTHPSARPSASATTTETTEYAPRAQRPAWRTLMAMWFFFLLSVILTVCGYCLVI